MSDEENLRANLRALRSPAGLPSSPGYHNPMITNLIVEALTV
jgi:hypothetical protein